MDELIAADVAHHGARVLMYAGTTMVAGALQDLWEVMEGLYYD